MVGDRSGLAWGQPETGIVDDRHQATAGRRSDQLIPVAIDALATHRPDFVLVHVGTNDVLQGYDSATAVAELARLVDEVERQLPGSTVVVATIGGCAEWRCGEVGERVDRFNADLRELVERLAASGSPIALADLAIGFDPVSMTFDGLHPDGSGDRHLADGWAAALEVLLLAG